MGICHADYEKIYPKREIKEIRKEIPKEIPKEILNKMPINGISHLENCLCKIKSINLNEYGLGFICKIPFPDKSNLLPVLITNDHILEKDDINIGNNIHLLLRNSKKEKILKIDNSRKTYSNYIYNITIIELKENELGNFFLEIDDNPYENIKNVYILEYLNDKKNIPISTFCIIDDSSFIHFCPTKMNFLGAPIMNLSNNKVLGIHKGQSETCNHGIFIKKPISDFYLSIIEEKKEKKEKNKISEKEIKNDNNSNKSNISNKLKNNINKNNENEGNKNIQNIKEDNKSENSANNSNSSNNNINQITNINEKEYKKINKEEIKNENNSNNSNNLKNKNTNKNIDSELRMENQSKEKNIPKNIINNQNKEISNNNNISNKEEDKEINLIFHIINKELNLDVKENTKFKKVIKQLYSKYLWLNNIDIIDYMFNEKSIEKEKTVKENGLKDNSNIELLENK